MSDRSLIVNNRNATDQVNYSLIQNYSLGLDEAN